LDISKLRSSLGLVTLDRGFANTAEGRSQVSFIDGEAVCSATGDIRSSNSPRRRLSSRWLTSSSTGSCRPKAELDDYVDSITRHTLLREDMKHLFEAFPHAAHPMQILASAVSAMATYYPDALDPLDEEAVDSVPVG
jgi:citrate synthase